MLVSIQPVPFADAGRQRQYAALAAALQAAADAPATVLLGNVGAFAPVEVDALIVRPASLTLVLLTPFAGQLVLPELPGQPWLLDGQPLPSQANADNPLVRYQQQLPHTLAWLGEQLGVPVAELTPCAGIALFEGPLTFGAGAEADLHQQAAAHDFQLVGGASALARRLALPSLAATAIAEEDLLDWANYLAEEPYVAHRQGAPESAADYLAAKLRQLWRWLGAEDIPADPPYGGFPAPDLAQRDQQEQARLHHLRQELQAELAQHRQEAATREAARTHELAQLRQQLAQASQPTAARQAEQRAQAALEAEMRTARAELAARQRELDARIQELGQLLRQLQAQAQAKALGAPVAASAAGPQAAPRSAPLPWRPPASAPAQARAARPVLKLSSYRPLRRAERWGVLLLGLALAGGGAWGVVHLVQQSAGPTRRAVLRRSTGATPRAESQRIAPVVVYDTLANDAAPYPTDETDSELAHAAPAPDASPVSTSPGSPLHSDSTRLELTPTPSLPDDSTTTDASPTP